MQFRVRYIHFLSLTLVLFSFCSTALWAQSQDTLGVMSQLRTAYDELAPVLSPDGSALYFTRAKHPRNVGGIKDAGDIWMATPDSLGRWSNPQPVKALNNPDFNAIAGFSLKGDTVFLHGKYSGQEGVYLQGVSYAVWQDSVWSAIKPITVKWYRNEAPHQSGVVAPHLGVMILSIEAFASRGAEDLYVAFRQPDGSYTGLKNMGDALNTRFQEMTPWLARDGQRLYFSSNGYGGQGRDLYVAERLDDTWMAWTKPRLVAEGLSGTGVDWWPSFDVAEQTLYYVANRNSQDYGDVQRYRFPEPLAPMDSITVDTVQVDTPMVAMDTTLIALDTTATTDTILLVDSVDLTDTTQLVAVDTAIDMDTMLATLDSVPQMDSVPLVVMDSLPMMDTTQLVVDTVPIVNPPVVVQAQVWSAIDSMPLPAQMVLRVDSIRYAATMDSLGLLTLAVPDSVTKGFLRVSAVGYFAQEGPAVLAELTGAVQAVYLNPLTVGSTVNLESVLFRRGTPEVLPESFEELDAVVELMNENPSLQIELGGHTDNRGNPVANLRLSEARVEAVKEYLVAQGINADRIAGKGYGGERPIADNEDEELRKLNRRVELKITGND